MQQDPSNFEDAQDYESFTLAHVPHTENTSYSSNVQENVSSNAPLVVEKTEHAESDEGLPTSPPPTPTISIVPISKSAFARKVGPSRMFLSLVLLLLVIVSYASFALATYVNSSTPQKTLDTFCSALQKQDYKTAYAQLSPTMQLNFTESQFATLLASDGVVRCMHGTLAEAGTSTTTSLSLVHRINGGTNNDRVTLTKDRQGQWKIDNLRTA